MNPPLKPDTVRLQWIFRCGNCTYCSIACAPLYDRMAITETRVIPPMPMNKDCSGFTLIETVVVLVLLGILAVNVVIRWPADNELKLPAQADLLATHLRHIQSLALYWGQPLRLAIGSGSYSVACVTASATSPCNNSPVIDPATGESFSTTLENGISLAGTATTDFDSLGRPVSGGSLITGARSFTLSAGTPTWTVTLSPLTGFVSSSP